jgi:hypothetical protein
MERDLTALERGILEFVLADPSLPAGDALRAQIPHLRVVDGIPPMPTYLHLGVATGAPRADCPDGKIPVDVVVESAAGEVTGFIMVWTKGGYLSTIEHPWVTDEMPLEFPPPESLRRWDPATNRIWDPRAC